MKRTASRRKLPRTLERLLLTAGCDIFVINQTGFNYLKFVAVVVKFGSVIILPSAIPCSCFIIEIGRPSC